MTQPVSDFQQVTTPDGRNLEVLTGGAEDGFPFSSTGVRRRPPTATSRSSR